MASSAAWADTVLIADGSQIHGKILRAVEGTLELETQFAGVIDVSLDAVARLITDEATVVRTANGRIIKGPTISNADRELTVNTGDGPVKVPLASVVAIWQPGAGDPIAAARRAELEATRRHWSYELALKGGGTTGNSETLDTIVAGAVALEGPHDRFKLSGEARYGEWDGDTSVNQGFVEFDYTRLSTRMWGWYARQKFEHDQFQDLELRTMTAAGLSHRFMETDYRRLEGRAGLSYRYEIFDEDLQGAGLSTTRRRSGGSVGFDFRLAHYWRFERWGELTNALSYSPRLEDLGDYLFEHRSYFDLPLGKWDRWTLRLSLTNRYDSEPPAGLRRLDTSYGLSVVLQSK